MFGNRSLIGSICLLILAAAFLVAPTPARAWGEAGQYVVCEIAWLNLTPAAKAEVARLIAVGGGYDTFTRSCNHASKPPRRAAEHFVNLPREAPRIDGPGCHGVPACVVSAVTTDLAILRAATEPEAVRSNVLKYLGNWVAVIHNPFHVSFADDWGGNNVAAHGLCTNSLHSAWDTCIFAERVLVGYGDRYTLAVAAAARLNATIAPEQARAWRGSRPWQWAAESYDIVLMPRTGYCVRKADGCWYSETAKTFAVGSPQRSQLVDAAYLDWAKPIVEDRLKRAGIRLAHELNLTFDPAYRG